jgi:predicted neuraminidase/peroxiredoxin
MLRPLIALMLLMSAGAAPALELGASPGPVPLTALEGHTRTLEHYGEWKATLVTFLSSRCDASRAAMPTLSEIFRSDTDEQLLMVGISANPAETSAELKSFLQRSGVTYPVYRDPEGAAARQLGATATPTCYLLDRKGNLVYRGGVVGAKAAVAEVLAGKSVSTPMTEAPGSPLDAPGTPAALENPYPPIYFASETIFEEIPGAPVHHCPSLAEAPNGDLICTWYGGSYESAEDQVVFISRLPKGTRAWTAPEVLVENPAQPPGNAVVFRGPADKLYLVWGRMEGSRPARRGTGWSKCRLMQRTSTDNGLTWDAPREIPNSLGWLPRNPPVWLDGALHLSISAGAGGRLLRLEADGETWTALGMLPHGEQLSIAERTDGSLLGIARSRPHVLESVSTDRGATWAQATPTTLKCPDSANCLLKLASGRYIIAHNDNNGWDRANLTLHQSEDEGKTWKEPRVLDDEARLEDGEFSYPVLLQSTDNRIHIVYTFRRYTIKHAVFNEAWLTQVVRPN